MLFQVKEEDKKDEGDEKKPKLKLASFASSLQKTSPVKTKVEIYFVLFVSFINISNFFKLNKTLQKWRFFDYK